MAKGFTIIELVVVVAILGVIVGFTVPNFDGWRDRRSFNNGKSVLQSAFSQARSEALSRNVTTRVAITGAAGAYVAEVYVAATAVSGCSSSGSWVSLGSVPLDMSERYVLAGASAQTSCFYRDGTASPANVTISSSSAPETATLSVVMATGVVDVQ